MKELTEQEIKSFFLSMDKYGVCDPILLGSEIFEQLSKGNEYNRELIEADFLKDKALFKRGAHPFGGIDVNIQDLIDLENLTKKSNIYLLSNIMEEGANIFMNGQNHALNIKDKKAVILPVFNTQ